MSFEPVRYVLDLSRRRQHLLGVTLTIPADCAAGARLVLPRWTPGSYVIRDYVHHLQSIHARHDGAEVALEPDGATAWRLPDDLDGAVEAVLELYANELTVRTNHVDDHHALVVAAATFPLVDGVRDRPHLVTLAPDDGERVFSLLPEADEPNTFVADDAWHLVDSAFEAGNLPVVDFDVAGVPHRFVWAGHGGSPDLDRLARDATAVADAAVVLFDGDLPVERYTFLCVGWDSGGGGLEHRDGAVLEIPVRVFQDDELYQRLVWLIAHEYLHQWNVKRLVPGELVEPDLERPTHSTALWVAEGWTAYYDEVLALRSGVWTLQRFLDAERDLVRIVLDTPGAALQSVRESSYQAWIKQYVRDENSRNVGVSYYAHGALLAWCLDLLLRREDPDGDGLDGALRLLWDRFGHTGKGYTEQDVQTAVEDAGGLALDWFFDRHVAGRELPPIRDLLDAVGLRLRVDDDADRVPFLGVDVTEDDTGVTLAAVLRGQPAWHAGLTGGDRLLAIDDMKVGRGELDTALRAHDAGDEVELAVFRGPRLLRLPVTLGDPSPTEQLVAVADPTDAQRTAFHRWTTHDLPTPP